jgi:hypothetical protein
MPGKQGLRSFRPKVPEKYHQGIHCMVLDILESSKHVNFILYNDLTLIQLPLASLFHRLAPFFGQ